MLKVMSLILVVYKNVIKINNKLANKMLKLKSLIHYPHKHTRSIWQAKWHNNLTQALTFLKAIFHSSPGLILIWCSRSEDHFLRILALPLTCQTYHQFLDIGGWYFMLIRLIAQLSTHIPKNNLFLESEVRVQHMDLSSQIWPLFSKSELAKWVLHAHLGSSDNETCLVEQLPTSN